MQASGVPWNDFGNLEVGDCAVAAPAHRLMAWSAAVHGQPVPVTTKQVIEAYSAITGYDPGKPETDLGSNMGDVEGWFRDVGLASHKTTAFVEADASNPAEMRAACWLFGGVCLGLNLPLAWEGVDFGGTWKGPVYRKDMKGKWAPGSWGGHAVYTGKYDPLGMDCITWGGSIRLTATACRDYCDQCLVALSKDWVDALGHAPSGVNWDLLRADLVQLQNTPA